MNEKIPVEGKVFRWWDWVVNPDTSPQFCCKNYEGEMYLEYYKNDLVVEFRISDGYKICAN